MPPPPLPETSLIIAPNKAAASKKRKRPAFRPGGKKKPAAAKDKPKSTSTTPTLTEEPTAETTTKTTTTAENQGVAKESEVEKVSEKENPTDDALLEEDGPAPASHPERAHPEPGTSAGDPKSTATSGPDNEDEVGPAGEESAHSRKENTPVSSKRNNNVDEANAAESNAAPEEATVASKSAKLPKKTAKAGATSKQSSAVKPSATKIAPAAKSLPRKRGRKPKSTGLVVGASRKQAASQQRQPKGAQQSTESSSTTNAAAAATPLANVPIEPATNAVAAVPLQLPPPKEGETALGQFCSKFKVKPRKSATKGQGTAAHKKKKEDSEKKKTKSDATNSNRQQTEPTSAGPVVQIINGEIVLQESSMVVQKGGQSASAGGGDDEEYAVVEEDNEMAIVGASYNSFVNRSTKPQHWSIEETKLFYEALRQVGTDFLLMSEFYPHRTRKQLKRKYQKEYIQNPKLVELALQPSQQKPLDLSIFQVDKTDIDQVKEQQKEKEEKEKERAAREEEKKEEEERDEARELSEEAATATAAKPEEDGMEVIEEEGDGEVMESQSCHHAPNPEPSSQSAEEEPLWPADKDHHTMAEEDMAVDEDTMMLEEFHHPDPENFDDIPAHAEDHHLDIMEDPSGADAEETTSAAAAPKEPEAEPPVATKQPAISLVPTAKKKSTKKPKFRSARPAKKKK